MLLSGRICLMNKARVVEIGSPTQLYERPTTRFGAEFLGESNILAGEATPEGIVVDAPSSAVSAATALASPGEPRWP